MLKSQHDREAKRALNGHDSGLVVESLEDCLPLPKRAEATGTIENGLTSTQTTNQPRGFR